MNGAQIHLLLNHLPVILPVAAVPILAVGLWRGSRDVQLVGLWLMIIAALSAIPTYLTGNEAESVVKNYPEISRSVMNAHRDFAFRSLLLLDVAGLVCLIALLVIRAGRNVSRGLWGALLLLCLAAVVSMAWAAHLGGYIRHEEIRPMELVQPAS